MARSDPDALKRRFVTPEGVDLRIELGTAGARAGAFILDWLMMAAIWIAIAIILGQVAFAAFSELIWQLAWLLMFLHRISWFILFEMGPRGATLGKRIVGLRVVARDGARLTAGAVIVRNAMREIEFYLPLQFVAMSLLTMLMGEDVILPLLALAWCMIFLFFPLFNRDRLRVGDLLAGTWVVHRPKVELGHDLAASAAQAERPRRAFTDAQLELYGIYELQTLEEVLRNAQSDAIVTVAATIRHKAGIEDDGDDYGFLSDYYAALCARLERGMMVGLKRADKYSQATRAA